MTNLVSDSIFQFFGGRLGKGNDQDLFDGDLFFEQEPEKQALNRVSFSGACAGLNEVDSPEGGMDETKWFHIHQHPLCYSYQDRILANASRPVLK